jgi:hypothetical protein
MPKGEKRRTITHHVSNLRAAFVNIQIFGLKAAGQYTVEAKVQPIHPRLALQRGPWGA